MNPFIGQLLLVGFNFAPYQWAPAQGQILAISQNTPLYALLGTYYGGDGVRTFALPNLGGNCAVGMGQGPGLSIYDMGDTGGTAAVTLASAEMPMHTHAVQVKSSSLDLVTSPSNNALADSGSAGPIYYKNTQMGQTQPMNPAAITPTGGGQPHNNMMPYQALNWVIALYGVFPQRP